MLLLLLQLLLMVLLLLLLVVVLLLLRVLMLLRMRMLEHGERRLELPLPGRKAHRACLRRRVDRLHCPGILGTTENQTLQLCFNSIEETNRGAVLGVDTETCIAVEPTSGGLGH